VKLSPVRTEGAYNQENASFIEPYILVFVSSTLSHSRFSTCARQVTLHALRGLCTDCFLVCWNQVIFMPSRLKPITRDVFYSAAELVFPCATVMLGGEQFRVPLRWRRWFGECYERATFDFVHTYCKPGATLIDIGAHFGIFTISALRRVGPSGKVISFEPCALTRSVLLQVLDLNGFGGMPEIRSEAVSNFTGESPFFLSPIPGDPANSLVGNTEHPTKLKIRTVRLDDVCLAHVDAIKIDAEGAEARILEGSRTLITRYRPAVLLSVHPTQIKRSGSSLSDLWELLESLKLVPYLTGVRVSSKWFRDQTELFDVCLRAVTI
jgi:FkbM family methyltransferase